MKLGEGILISDIQEEYDSPLKLILQKFDEERQKAYKQIDRELGDAIYTATLKYGFDIDEEKLVQILKGDKERYMEAFRKGYEAAIREWILIIHPEERLAYEEKD